MTYDDAGWHLVASGFDRRTARAWEGLFTLGSHELHVRGSLAEHLDDASQTADPLRRPANVTAESFSATPARWGTYVPGVYGPHPLLGRCLVNLPWPLGLAPIIDGERLEVTRADLPEHRRRLNLRSAVLDRSLVWRCRSGVTVSVQAERFVSAVRPRLIVQRCTLVADRRCRLELVAGIDADVRTNGHDHLAEAVLERSGPASVRCRARTDGGDDLVIACELRGQMESWSARPAPRRLDLAATLTLEPGRPFTIEKRTSVHAGPSVVTDDDAGRVDFETLLTEHAEAWDERWRRCDVRIDGDDRSQLALRVALHHLLRAHPRSPRLSIDAKAYAGEAYFGRFFWDADIFMLPFYLYTDPARAIELLEFRIATLAGSRRNAERYGLPGARVAWEADPEGDECCPGWMYADHELHVTADVAYALAHAAAAAGDRRLLEGRGAELVVETARYWLARLDVRPGATTPSLLGVMGPDEYTPLCDNNAFTNRMVSFALTLASDVGARGGATDAERRAFAQAARSLPIPHHPDDPTLVLQCEGFHRLPDPAFDRWWSDRDRPFATQVPQERLFRTRCLKQADALMLALLFPDELDADQTRRVWDEYVPVTTHDSSLSPGVHAIIAARLGLDEQAWSFWSRATSIDLDVDRGGAAEGIHAANAGLLWLAAMDGFCGLRSALAASELTLAPRLPDAWRRVDAALTWRGTPLQLTVTRHEVTIRSTQPDADLRAIVRGTPKPVRGVEPTVW